MTGPTVTTVWQVDPNRWYDDPTYRHAVEHLVTTHLPYCSPWGAVVRQDETGARALIATSFVEPDGHTWHLDPTGHVTQAHHVARLPEGTQLP